MARDVFAVPATGAGVERQFSKSGRIATCPATWARALLHPDTARDIMMYKDYLSRTGKPLTHGRRGLEMRYTMMEIARTGTKIQRKAGK